MKVLRRPSGRRTPPRATVPPLRHTAGPWGLWVDGIDPPGKQVVAIVPSRCGLRGRKIIASHDVHHAEVEGNALILATAQDGVALARAILKPRAATLELRDMARALLTKAELPA